MQNRRADGRFGLNLKCLKTDPKWRPGGLRRESGCGNWFPLWTMKERGQARCPLCLKKTRYDARTNGNGAVGEGRRYNHRWEAQKAAFEANQQPAPEEPAEEPADDPMEWLDE